MAGGLDVWWGGTIGRIPEEEEDKVFSGRILSVVIIFDEKINMRVQNYLIFM